MKRGLKGVAHKSQVDDVSRGKSLLLTFFGIEPFPLPQPPPFSALVIYSNSGQNNYVTASDQMFILESL